MATAPSKTTNMKLSLPTSLSVKDLITIVSATVTLTLAWGVFSSRLALLEREIVALQASDQAQSTALDKLLTQVQRNAAHQQDDELLIDQVFMLLRKPPPTRRSP